MNFVFTAEPDPARNGWRIVCRSGADRRFVLTRQFRTKATARIWARRLTIMAERELRREFPDPSEEINEHPF
jgi:hypothetical protein